MKAIIVSMPPAPPEPMIRLDLTLDEAAVIHAMLRASTGSDHPGRSNSPTRCGLDTPPAPVV